MFNLTQSQAIYGINNANKQTQILLNQLETGKRINSAKDDASGLAISMRLQSQHRGLSQAIRNTNDTVSLTNVADSALNEYTDIIQKAREKANQAVSDTNSVESRAALQEDVKALMESAEAIAQNTTFNGIKLLDGSFTNKKFQIGAFAGQTTTISIGDVKTTTLGIDNASIDLSSSAGATTALTSLDDALDTLSGVRSTIGATTRGLESRIRGMEHTSLAIKSAESQIMDVDEAQVKSEVDKWTIRSQAAVFAFSMSQQAQQNILRLLQ
jgi:flagellin